MNWTGGRLQRSKANANTLVKIQKQHFAKARLRLQHGQPSQSPVAFSISHGQYGHNTETQDNTPVGDHHRQGQRPSSQETLYGGHRNGRHSPRSKHHYHNSIAQPRRKRRRSEGPLDRRHGDVPATASGLVRHIRNAAQETTPSLASVVDHDRKSAEAEANTLQNVKRNLLAKSDWMGLSAARPLRMAYIMVEEMENISKRRRITEADGHRKVAANLDSCFRPTINRNHRMDQSGSNASVLHTEDASVRIGANIHQTQTTPPLGSRERQIPNASQIASTDSMLLERLDRRVSLLDQARKCEEDLRPTDSQHSPSPDMSFQDDTGPSLSHSNRVNRFEGSQFLSDLAHTSSVEEQFEVDTGRSLPTLDALRDHKSFDELKARDITKSSNRIAFLAPSLPRHTAQKEAAQNGRSIGDSSSVVNGRRLLPSCEDLPQPAGKGSVVDKQLSHCEVFRDYQATRPDPTKLSSGFWPERPTQSISQVDVDIRGRVCPCGPQEQANSPAELDISARKTAAHGMAALEPGCQSGLGMRQATRRVFTLEQQVSDEAMAKSQIDASRSSPSDLLKRTDSIRMASSTTGLNQSWTRSPARPSQYGGFLNHEAPPSSRPDEVAAPRTSARHAARSRIESLGAISARDISLELSDVTMQAPSQKISKAIRDPSVMPSLFRPTLPNGAIESRRLQLDNNLLSKTQSRSSRGGTATDRQDDETEAWMGSVIPGFDGFRNPFEFEPTKQRRRPNGESSSPQKALEAEEISRLNELAWRPDSNQAVQDTSPAKSIHTSANTVLCSAEDPHSSSQSISVSQPWEADFLTHMSPMEGKLDEHLADVSVYNNAARSIRSFVPATGREKRSLRPLQNDAVVACAYISGLPRTSSPPTGSARENHADIRGLRAPRHLMSFPPLSYTPTRGMVENLESHHRKMTTSGELNHSQAYLLQNANGGLVESVRRHQVWHTCRRDREPVLQRSEVLSAPRTRITETFDEYPFTNEVALHMMSTDSLEALGGSPSAATATARTSLVLHNIHTEMNQLFTFKKPRLFDNVQSTPGR